MQLSAHTMPEHHAVLCTCLATFTSNAPEQYSTFCCSVRLYSLVPDRPARDFVSLTLSWTRRLLLLLLLLRRLLLPALLLALLGAVPMLASAWVRFMLRGCECARDVEVGVKAAWFGHSRVLAVTCEKQPSELANTHTYTTLPPYSRWERHILNVKLLQP